MRSRAATETSFGILAALTGLGIVTFTLFPLSLPILILTLAALVPLLALGAVVAVPVGVIAVAVLGVRAIRRRARRGRDSVTRDGPRHRPASPLADRGKLSRGL
jgi:hypothetical protein